MGGGSKTLGSQSKLRDAGKTIVLQTMGGGKSKTLGLQRQLGRAGKTFCLQTTVGEAGKTLGLQRWGRQVKQMAFKDSWGGR